MKIESLLDKNQRNLAGKFPEGSWLSDQSHVNAAIDWTSFYRANLHRFNEHYLELKLYPYQRLALYRLGVSDETVMVAARAAAKSWLIAILGVDMAILYPGSKVVIASGTLKQAKLIVTEKIEKELMGASAALRAEIKKISTHGDEVEVIFKNGSSIIVVVGNENARGHRSTIVVYEEFRMIKKFVIDSVISQFQIIRQTGYKDMPEYESLPPEESKSIYISSAWFRSHWMWNLIKDNAKHVAQGGSRYTLLAFDYVITLYHKIKTRAQLAKIKRQSDPTTWKIESENLMVGEGENSYFNYETLSAAQVIKTPVYPRRSLTDDAPKKNSTLAHQEGEVRILACDMAFVSRKGNDNSIFSVIRLLPEESAVTGFSYRKQVVYMESVQGGDTVKQALRIKQIFYDTACDYCVLDTRNGGIAVADILARPTFDDGSQNEYPPWQCMNDENIAGRIRSEGAVPVLFSVTASAKLNSDIAMLTQRQFLDGNVSLLIPYQVAMDDILPKNKAYMSTTNLDAQMSFEKPYIETQALIGEMVELAYDRMPDTGIIRIHEQGANTKDRYKSLSYGLYFASLMEKDMHLTGAEYEFGAFAN